MGNSTSNYSIKLAVYTKRVGNFFNDSCQEEFVYKTKMVYDRKRNPIVLTSNDLIDSNIGKELIESIQPLQENEHNFDERISDAKSQLQELIPQFQYFNEYKAAKKISYKKVPVSIAPAIYSLEQNKLLTEINGLEYYSNIKLYQLIATIIPKFIPLFEHVSSIKILNKYKNIPLIIKIQDYIFNKYSDTLAGNWHTEGDEEDDVIAIGLYYFNITQNKHFKYTKDSLEIVKEECDRAIYENDLVNIDIKENDCIILKNAKNIKYRTHIETQTVITDNINNEKHKLSSRKILSFFLIEPKSNLNPDDFKWINFPLKTEMFISSFLKYDMEFISTVSNDIIDLIAVYAFGNDKYQRDMITQFRKNRGSNDNDKKCRPFPSEISKMFPYRMEDIRYRPYSFKM